MVEVRNRLKKYSDLRVSVRNLTSLRQGAPVDIDFSITGPDAKKLQEDDIAGEDRAGDDRAEDPGGAAPG